MGFDPKTIRADARAKSVFGETLHNEVSARFHDGQLRGFKQATRGGELNEFLSQVDPGLAAAVATRLGSEGRTVALWRATKGTGIHGVEAFHRAMELESAGRLKGLDDWVQFTMKESNKQGDDLHNAVFELIEASNVAGEGDPGEIGNVGGDARP